MAVQVSVAGIVSPACVQIAAAVISAPDDHLTAGPHCRVKYRAIGRIGRCWWLSSYQCWDCISRQCSKSPVPISTPDNHFTASPDCRVTAARRGRIGGAGGCPGVIGASAINLWKSVGSCARFVALMAGFLLGGLGLVVSCAAHGRYVVASKLDQRPGVPLTPAWPDTRR